MSLRVPREMEIYRLEMPNWSGDHGNGAFQIPSRGLRIIVSDGGGWDHVSVSRQDRCPTWDEMEWVKRKFFHDSDCCMQLHVPVSDHKNCHPHCLHIWRPQEADIPRPPSIMVAP